MGGAVSSGRDNDELIDNLMGRKYIRTRQVERVFRALDRAEYMTPESRDRAYKDLAWRNGYLHMSAPCLYGKVVEALELRPGLSFLNVGSGTGYLSTLVGLLIGSSGINHGIEVHSKVLEYSEKKLEQFIENSPILDDFDFCVPKFYSGNALCLAVQQPQYDRIYCGGGCPPEFFNYFKQLLKDVGVLVIPLTHYLLHIKRSTWQESTSHLLRVAVPTLELPSKEEASDPFRLEDQCPTSLQVLCRAVIRKSMREAHLSRNPHLREPPRTSAEGLNALHDFDHMNGANEMNAQLSPVWASMGQNRVAGVIPFDSLDSPSLSSSDEQDDGGGGDNDDNDDDSNRPSRPTPLDESERPHRPERSHRTERPHRPKRPHRPERPHRPDCEDRTEKSDPIDRSDSFKELTDDRRSSSEPTTNDEEPNQARYEVPGNVIRAHSLITNEIQDNSTKNARSSRCPDASSSNDSQTPKSSGETRKRTSMRGIPTEVKINLGKDRPSISRSVMNWESNSEMKREISSDEDTTETSKGNIKMLDSGIGERTTTSSDLRLIPIESNEEDESDLETEEPEYIPGTVGKVRRIRVADLQARGPRAPSAGLRVRSGSSRVPDSTSDGCTRSPELSRRNQEARRVHLSVLMKRGVKELPLPYALKKYVNLGRCFEF